MSALFTPAERFHDGFLSGAIGQIAIAPQACYCQVRFDQTHYHDALYDDYGIDFPDPIRRSVVKRKAEYLAGRYCCAQILQGFNAPIIVGNGARREPLWPRGFCGAITHSQDRALAVISPTHAGLYPGVDIEFFAVETLRAIVEEIVTATEYRYLQAGPIDLDAGLLLAFSAKESLFKSLYPRVERYLGFSSASITDVSPERGEFVLQLNEPLSVLLPAGRRFNGQFRFNGSAITTLIL